jgi:hypothetical protein
LTEDPRIQASVEEELKEIWQHLVGGTPRNIEKLYELARPASQYIAKKSNFN